MKKQHKSNKANKANKEKLVKLADYIFELDPKVFHMRYFRANNKGKRVDYFNKNNCGTVGSALGWSPFVKGLKPIDSDFEDYYRSGKLELCFMGYSGRLFGLNFKEWEWCFSDKWVKTDNTPIGASKRIMELVNEGLPDNWEAQMLGKAPYMFAKKRMIL